MLPTAALNTFNQPSRETPVGARLLCLRTSRWRHHCDPSLNTDGANCHFALRRCTHITESQPSCLLNIPPNSISDICLRCLTPLSFPQFCYQPTKWIWKKKKKSLLLVISRRVDTHNSLQKAAAFFLTVVAVWSCATSPLKHEVYFCTFSKPFAAPKKNRLRCAFWYAACDRLGSLSAHLNGIVFAARSPIHILQWLQHFLFFFKKHPFVFPPKTA